MTWKGLTVESRARESESMNGVRGALARQGDLWRALLTGEDARQMLGPDTFVAAPVRHASRLGTLIRGLAGAFLPAMVRRSGHRQAVDRSCRSASPRSTASGP